MAALSLMPEATVRAHTRDTRRWISASHHDLCHDHEADRGTDTTMLRYHILQLQAQYDLSKVERGVDDAIDERRDRRGIRTHTSR